jgi:hypothetical protein
MAPSLLGLCMEPGMHFLWCHCSQWLLRLSHLQAIFVPSRLIFVWGLHYGFHGCGRVQRICGVCMGLWCIRRWIQLFTEDVHLRKGSSQKLCSGMGICSILYGNSFTGQHTNFRYCDISAYNVWISFPR